MKALNSTVAGLACALILSVAASPAVAGHKHGGYYSHGGHKMYPHKGHPRCHAKVYRQHPRYGYGGYPGHQGKKMHAGYSKPSLQQGYSAGRGYPGRYGSAGGYGRGQSADYTASESATPAASQDIVGMATAAGNFSTLLSAVNAAGLTETLQGKGPFTVLAPTDSAFSKLPKEQVAELMSDPDALKGVLTYHVISGKLSAADLLVAGEAETVSGAKLTLAELDVAKADIEASNGVIHVLDSVLLPAE